MAHRECQLHRRPDYERCSGDRLPGSRLYVSAGGGSDTERATSRGASWVRRRCEGDQPPGEHPDAWEQSPSGHVEGDHGDPA